jgi:DNA polymerase-3 subunit gamma/tau
MEHFIVSARKYRPATFDSVVGQDNITSTLKNAIRNNQLAQAFLFTGPRGVGKTTCARIFAKTINCMNLGENLEPCNKCESCVSFNKNASFNIHELDAASNNSVDDIRNLVDQVRIPPQVGKYKVYIIDEVHMLSPSAFNAFLKTLEEPPDYAKFILATTEKHKIIPTILSRCQIYDFKRITVPDIIKYLSFVAEKEGVDAEPLALNVIAQKADGAMRDALSLFDQLVNFAGNHLTYDQVRENLNVLDYEYYFKITGYFLQGDISSVLLTFNEILEAGFDGQHFIAGLGSHLRDLLVCKDPSTLPLLEVGNAIEPLYREQAQNCPVDFLLKGLNIIQKTDFTYKSSNNKRLHIEVALMQLASVTGATAAPVAAAQTFGDIKKKTEITPAQQQQKPQSATTSPPPIKQEPSSTQQQPSSPPQKDAGQPHSTKKPAAGRLKNRGIFSIKDSEEKPQESAEPEQEYIDVNSEAFLNAKKIIPDELENAWKAMAKEFSSEEEPLLTSTLQTIKPRIGEQFEVLAEVKNSVQQGAIEAKKSDIIRFLRDMLGNRFIRLKTLVNSTPVEAKPYDPVDIFRHMAQKNPALITLKEKFGLEPE